MKKTIFLWLVALTLVFANATEQVAPQTETETAGTNERTEAYFLPAEVSEAASEVIEELREINTSIRPSKADSGIENALPSYIESLDQLLDAIKIDDLERSSIKRLRSTLEQATVYTDQLDDYKTRFDRRVELHTQALERLKALEDRWIATLRFAQKENAPEAIIGRIESTLVAIATLRDAVKRSYDKVLTYRDKLVSEDSKMHQMIEKVTEAKEKLSTRFFVRDRDPLIETIERNRFDWKGYASAFWQTLQSIPRAAYQFYKDNIEHLYLHAFLTSLVGMLMLYLNYKDRRSGLFLKRDKKVQGSIIFIRNPIAATVILSVLMIGAIYPERPTAVAVMNAFVAIVALIVIVQKIVKQALPFIYLVMMLYFVGAVQDLIIGYETETRIVWFLVSIMLFTALTLLMRTKRYQQWGRVVWWTEILRRFLPLLVLIVAASVFANLFGAYNLAHSLTFSAIVSLLLFIAFTIIALVFNGLIVMLVRRRARNSSLLIDTYAERIERQLKVLVNMALLLYWLYLVVKSFGVMSVIVEWFRRFLDLSWDIGNLHFSMAAIFNFLFILTITFFLTRFVRILLDLELFSRYRFPRGVPAAIQMILRYTILTVGVIVALHALGIELSDLSLLAGALGVGIGFGLRNIMANFISGIIMVFERPVQEGDVVQVDGTFGDVQKIGVRATTIKTYDGSEVIVPNADFVTKEVINWTLSSKHRRVKMTYKVAFGSEPMKVIEIIRATIDRHPDVKSDPAPKVLFDGYGDYYLAFTVYFWVDERLMEIKSETAIAIYEALQKEGISMPVPFSSVRYEGGSPV